LPSKNLVIEHELSGYNFRRKRIEIEKMSRHNFKKLTKVSLVRWCERHHLDYPKNLLKADLAQWCEAQDFILAHEETKARLKQEQERAAWLQSDQYKEQLRQAQAAVEEQRKAEWQQSEAKKQADLEWQARLDAYLSHTLPKTYKRETDTEWRKPQVSLLDII
jgi:hypothetical protein